MPERAEKISKGGKKHLRLLLSHHRSESTLTPEQEQQRVIQIREWQNYSRRRDVEQKTKVLQDVERRRAEEEQRRAEARKKLEERTHQISVRLEDKGVSLEE